MDGAAPEAKKIRKAPVGRATVKAAAASPSGGAAAAAVASPPSGGRKRPAATQASAAAARSAAALLLSATAGPLVGGGAPSLQSELTLSARRVERITQARRIKEEGARKEVSQGQYGESMGERVWTGAWGWQEQSFCTWGRRQGYLLASASVWAQSKGEGPVLTSLV